MGGFAVIRCGGDDCRDAKHLLSVLSLVEDDDDYVSENFELPFDEDEPVLGGSCGGLLYFHGQKGKIVICNIKTQELKVLPLPVFENTPPHLGILVASGLGYDAKSRDYKLIRSRVQYYGDEVRYAQDGDESYESHKIYFDLYSFRSGSWKEIMPPCSDADVFITTCGVYVGGSCYWTALYDESGYWTEETCDDLSRDPFWYGVMSFDLATDSFERFPLPIPATTSDTSESLEYVLVECRGFLGALAYWRPHDDESCSELFTELFVWKATSWDVLYHVSLADVERPLGLKDDHLLFLEAKPSGRRHRRSRVMVCDLDDDDKKLKKLNMYDYPEYMSGISYTYCRPWMKMRKTTGPWMKMTKMTRTRTRKRMRTV